MTTTLYSISAIALFLLAGCDGGFGERDKGTAECCEPTDAGDCVVRFIDYRADNPFDDVTEREICAELGLEPAPRRHYEEIEL